MTNLIHVTDFAFNNNLLELMLDDNTDAFDAEFINKSKKQPFLKKQDIFDGNQTIITV